MIAQGIIQEVHDDYATVLVPLERAYLIEKQNITSCEVRFEDGRTITPIQRNKSFAIMNDISAHTGHCLEELKEYFKNDLMSKTSYDYFSLSAEKECSATVTQAREYISNLIDFCFEWDIPTRDTLLNQTEDMGRYLYACLYHRKCAICNKKAEIHHCTGSKVGMGFNRNKINNLGRSAIALCRHHHNVAHNEEREFFEKHHVFGIRLDEHLLKKLKL